MNSTYPLDPIISSISTTKNISNEQVTCEDVKEILSQVDENQSRIYNINFKEDTDNNLILFFYNEQHENLINGKTKTNEVEDACKSCVYNINPFTYVCSQFNRIIYNEEVLNLLNPNLENVIVQKCYEGTTLLVFNHNNKWFISTRKCIDASESTWVKNQSYKELFEETIGENIYNVLNPNYCYVFILVHYKNKNIVNYNQPFKYQNRYYKHLYLSSVTIKGTFDEITLNRNQYNLPNVLWTEEIKFQNVEEMLNNLKTNNDRDVASKNITTEGYAMKIYSDSNKQGKFIIGKLQTEIYRYIMNSKPNVQNVYQIYLEFYKQDKLTELLPYFYKGKNSIVLKIHNSMKILTKEMLELYHMTRNKRNEALYELMPKIYKKVLYDLHGLYIKNKKGDEQENVNYELTPTNTITDEKQLDNKLNKSINIHDVYNFLKTMPLKQIIKIFQEREKLVEEGKIKCLNTKDMDIVIYTKYLLD